ncbi:hypothetical protein [Helicobacter bilis]|nr:hypothetical protein [Helicobacter bilis]MDD7295947.1 hypothetical protein [Helicobacter bilis]MDY4400693.1 hypothetical protein [Helicobacter bilis]
MKFLRTLINIIQISNRLRLTSFYAWESLESQGFIVPHSILS